MIATQIKTYNYFTFGARDEYGQPALSTAPEGQIKIAINILSQSVVDNVKYKDCSYIGLTMDKSVKDTWVIQYGNVKLKVLYVNHAGRYTQVFLKEI